MNTSRVITFSFTENFIDNLSQWIVDNLVSEERDLRRTAIVFGGRRPGLFLKRALAQKFKQPFFAPQIFTIDEFINQSLLKEGLFAPVFELEHTYILYKLAQRHTPQILVNRTSFAQFLPWAKEILSFIDQLDLESVTEDALKNIQANAHIGYSVPRDINRLLEEIATLRHVYHAHCLKERVYSRGFQYLRLSQTIDHIAFDEFDQILFCNFFYLHKTEHLIFKDLFKRQKSWLFFQGDERRWPALSRLSRSFGAPIVEGDEVTPTKFELKLYAGFDGHSQVALVRDIVGRLQNPSKAVIVLPNPDQLVPLLSELTEHVKDFNVSMGYPLNRSSLMSLLEAVFAGQSSLQDGKFYTRDYLKILRHPIVKNLRFKAINDTFFDVSVVRVLVHKIEEVLTGAILTPISGSLFLDPHEIVGLDVLYEEARRSLKAIDVDVSRDELRQVNEKIHELFAIDWQKVRSFREFLNIVGDVLTVLEKQFFLQNYPLEQKILERLQELVQEFRKVSFLDEAFAKEDLFRIFKSRMENEMIAFAGSPLKGLQILGLLETRSLNFEEVIVLDVNEGVLPHLKIYEPLIPREVMISLNLDRLELEEEIQRYQFMRLISAAKRVHLIFQEGVDKQRSRLVEELIWNEEKKVGRVNVVPITRPALPVHVDVKKREVEKTPEMIAFLRSHTFSSSSINAYLRNPMEFYYSYCLGLREREDLLDEPENRQVGTFLHGLLEDTFKRFVGKKPAIDHDFRDYFMHLFRQRFDVAFGQSMVTASDLLKTVMEARLEHFLNTEEIRCREDVKEIVFIEKRFENTLPLSVGPVKFVYRVDRVDQDEDGAMTILDYKTGANDPMPKGVEALAGIKFSRETIRETVRSFQMPLYFDYLTKTYPGRPIKAVFYNLRTMKLDYFQTKDARDVQAVNAAYLKALDFIVAEIFNPAVAFAEDLSQIRE